MKNNKFALKIISCGVILLHTSGIIWLGWFGESPEIQQPDKKIVVKTVALSQPKTVTKAPPPPKPKPTPVPKKKEAPIAKVEVKKEVPVPKKEEKKADVEKREYNPLIAKAQEMLSKVKRKNNELQTAKQIDKLEIDSPISSTRYHEIVGTKIKQVLRLPEKGAVKIHLTLNRTGKVLEVDFISDESKLNREYVKAKLPQLSFPNFGTFLKEEKHTFLITLQSEA